MEDKAPESTAPAKPTCKPWQSRTIWVSAIMSVAVFFPGVNTWIALNPETFTLVMGGIFTVLRIVSKDKIVIK